MSGLCLTCRTCSKAVYKSVWHIQLLSVQWINSWWWTEELSETCRISCQNKLIKLVHLVCFIIKKFITMHGNMKVKFCHIGFQFLDQRKRSEFLFHCRVEHVTIGFPLTAHSKTTRTRDTTLSWGVSDYLPVNMAQHPRSSESSSTRPWEAEISRVVSKCFSTCRS